MGFGGGPPGFLARNLNSEWVPKSLAHIWKCPLVIQCSLSPYLLTPSASASTWHILCTVNLDTFRMQCPLDCICVHQKFLHFYRHGVALKLSLSWILEIARITWDIVSRSWPQNAPILGTVCHLLQILMGFTLETVHKRPINPPSKCQTNRFRTQWEI